MDRSPARKGCTARGAEISCRAFGLVDLFRATGVYLKCPERCESNGIGRRGKQMRIWLWPRVPGKALPGERARRRAVEGSEGAEQAYPPMLRRASQLATRVASQWPADSHPRNTPRRLGKAKDAVPFVWPVVL